MTAIVASLLLLSAPAAAKREPFNYGPPPNWAEYKQLGEAALRAALPDQEKWSVEWPNGFIPYTWDHKGNYPGYMTCGIMRAVAPVTGRYPLTNFIIVIDRGVVKNVDIAPRARNDIRNQVCIDWVARGMFPPARLMDSATDRSAASTSAATVSSDNLAITPLGVMIRPMPDGAYVISAEPGSPGQRAGLAPGIVITRANGIPLGGLAAAMAKVLASDPPTLALETASGDLLNVTRKAP